MTLLTKSQSNIYKNNQTEIENELLRQIMYMKHEENEAINYNEHCNNIDLNKLSTIREEDSKFKHLQASSDINHEQSKDTHSYHYRDLKLDAINQADHTK